MRIVFSGNTSWSMYNFRLGVMKKFLSLGYEVYTVAPWDNFTEKIEQEGIRVVTIKNLKRSETNPIREFKLLREYISVYKALQPDIIFHFTIKPNIYGTLAARYCNIACISVTTGLGNAFSKKGVIFLAAKYLYKISSSYSKETWFLNENDRDLFVKSNVLPLSKTFILPGEGVDTSRFPATQYPLKEEPVEFLLIARMLYDKGVGYFVEASKILKAKGYNISSVLVGDIDKDNPQNIGADQLAKWDAEGAVSYKGGTQNVKPFIENSHCMVLPSFYKEGLPRILLEAACMERPIITAVNPGCVDILDDGVNGFLCQPRDAADLADKMEKFIKLSYLEKINMGKAGRKKVLLKFDENIIIDIYLQKFTQYAGKK